MDRPDFSVSAEVRERGEASAVVSMTGRAGVANTAWFRQLLELQAARGLGHIVLDLSQLLSMDWWTALMLLWVGRVLSRHGATLVLAATALGGAATACRERFADDHGSVAPHPRYPES